MQSKHRTQIESRRYSGEPEDYEYGDPKVGHGVPKIVRRGGATKPLEKEELAGNGTAFRGHAALYECENCGALKRFVTADFMTRYYCDECGETHFFEFQWEFNRGASL